MVQAVRKFNGFEAFGTDVVTLYFGNKKLVKKVISLMGDKNCTI